ncbi:MAG: flagellar basal body-associated FliL family protein [Burkholderiaceae bacterium]
MAEEKNEAPARKGKGKMIALVAGAMLLVAGAAGGGAWYFASGSGGGATVTSNADGDETGKRQRRANQQRVFVPMDQFVVNLSDAQLDRYAQVAVVLEVADSPTETRIKASMPAIRNAVLLLLSARSAPDLLSLEGKEQLAIDIALAAHAVLAQETPPRPAVRVPDANGRLVPSTRSFDDVDTGPIAAVHFSQFIVQ